jgi:pimeloyl-ACP methyl ester carboxylesterase
MPFFESSSYTFYYNDSGSKSNPAITFIHGWTASSKIYNSQIEYFSSKYRVVAIDLLGHGQSDKPDPVDVGQLYEHAGFQDSILALLSHLSIESTILVGWSLGCQIAFEIARCHPQKVTALILLAASPLFFLPTDEMSFPALPKSAEEALLNSLQNSFDEIYRGLVFGFFPEYSVDDNSVPEYIETQVQDTGKVGGKIAYGILRLVAIRDFRSSIPEITTPTLIIAGGKDKLTPPEAGQWILKHLGGKDKKLILYEEVGHVAFVGPTAERFNSDVDGFLETI